MMDSITNTVMRPIAPPGARERCFTFVLLLLSSGAFLSLTVKTGEPPGASESLIGKIISSTVYIVIFVLLVRHCKGFLRAIWQERFLSLLLALAVCSTFWSDDPVVTFRRSLALVATSMFGLYFSMRYDLKHQVRILAGVCGFSAVCSLFFGLFSIGNSVDGIPDAWFGIYLQRNSLGRMMVFSALVFYFLGKIDPKRKWIARAFILLSFILMLLSKSQTALVVFSVLFTVLFTLVAFRRSVWRGVIVLCFTGTGLITAVYWAVTHIQTATAGLDRSVTLSGRLQLWALSIFMALQRPWLGYGYCAFWEGDKGPSERIWRALHMQVPHSHDGFLDLWLDLGLVGLAVFATGFGVYAWRALRSSMKSWPESAWPLTFLCFFLLYNLTESTLLVRDTNFWALYSGIAFSLSAQVVRGSSGVRVAARAPQIAYGVR
jgi:exopolysaccharide production protein ExoQ